MTLETLILICPFCSLVRRLVTTATLIVKDIFYAVNSKKIFCQPFKNIWNLPLRRHEHPGLVLPDLGPVLAREVVDIVALVVAHTTRGLPIKFNLVKYFHNSNIRGF